MPTYYVTMPATAALTFTVEAEDEKSAIDAAFGADWTAEFKGCECDEMDIHRQIVRGNVFSGVINEISVEEA